MIPQLLAHLWGDYILQSDWMAQNKTKSDLAALVHAEVYSLCFIPLVFFHGRNWLHIFLCAWAISYSHYLIDRYRLARYVVWAKNWMGPKKFWYRHIGGGKPIWTDNVEFIKQYRSEPFDVDNYYIWYGPTPPLWGCPDGYPPTTPPFLSTWLLIIAGNTLHLTINYLALRYL